MWRNSTTSFEVWGFGQLGDREADDEEETGSADHSLSNGHDSSDSESRLSRDDFGEDGSQSDQDDLLDTTADGDLAGMHSTPTGNFGAFRSKTGLAMKAVLGRVNAAWTHAKRAVADQMNGPQHFGLRPVTPRLMGCWVPPLPLAASQAAAANPFLSVFASSQAQRDDLQQQEEHLTWRRKRRSALDAVRALIDQSPPDRVMVFVAGTVAEFGLAPSDLKHQVMELADSLSNSKGIKHRRPPPVETLARYAHLICSWLAQRHDSVAVVLGSSVSWPVDALLAACLLYTRFVHSSQLALELVGHANRLKHLETRMPATWCRALHWLARAWLAGHTRVQAPALRPLALILHGVPRPPSDSHICRPLVDVRDGNTRLLCTNAADASAGSAALLDCYDTAGRSHRSTAQTIHIKLSPSQSASGSNRNVAAQDVHFRLSHVAVASDAGTSSADAAATAAMAADSLASPAPEVHRLISWSAHTAYTGAASSGLVGDRRRARLFGPDVDVVLETPATDDGEPAADTLPLTDDVSSRHPVLPPHFAIDMVFGPAAGGGGGGGEQPEGDKDVTDVAPMTSQAAGDTLLFGSRTEGWVTDTAPQSPDNSLNVVDNHARAAANQLRDSQAARLAKRVRKHHGALRQLLGSQAQHDLSYGQTGADRDGADGSSSKLDDGTGSSAASRRAEAACLHRARSTMTTARAFHRLFGHSVGQGLVVAHHSLLLERGSSGANVSAGGAPGDALALAASTAAPSPGTLYVSARYLAFCSAVAVDRRDTGAGSNGNDGTEPSEPSAAVSSRHRRRILIPWSHVRELTPLSGAQAPRLCARALRIEVVPASQLPSAPWDESSWPDNHTAVPPAAPGVYLFGWIEPRAKGLAAASRAWSTFCATRAAAVAASVASPSAVNGSVSRQGGRSNRGAIGGAKFDELRTAALTLQPGEAAEGSLPIRDWQALQLGASAPETVQRGTTLDPLFDGAVYRIVDGVVCETAVTVDSDAAAEHSTDGGPPGTKPGRGSKPRHRFGWTRSSTGDTNASSSSVDKPGVKQVSENDAALTIAAARVAGPGDFVGVAEFFLDEWLTSSVGPAHGHLHRATERLRAHVSAPGTQLSSIPFDYLRKIAAAGGRGQRSSGPGSAGRDSMNRSTCELYWFLAATVACQVGAAIASVATSARQIAATHPDAFGRSSMAGNALVRELDETVWLDLFGCPPSAAQATTRLDVLRSQDATDSSPQPQSEDDYLDDGDEDGDQTLLAVGDASAVKTRASGSLSVGGHVQLAHSCFWVRHSPSGAGGDAAFSQFGEAHSGGGSADRLFGEIRCGASVVEFRARVFGFDVRRVIDVRLLRSISLSKYEVPQDSGALSSLVLTVADGGTGDPLDPPNDETASVSDFNSDGGGVGGKRPNRLGLVQLRFDAVRDGRRLARSLRRAAVAQARMHGTDVPPGILAPSTDSAAPGADHQPTRTLSDQFDGLTDRDWRMLLAEAQIFRLQPGDAVGSHDDHQGDGGLVYRVMSGRVAVVASQVSGDGPRVVVDVCTEGHCFGELALFPFARSDLGVRHDTFALGQGTVVHGIPATWIRALSAVDPALGRRLGRWLGRQLATRAVQLRNACARLGSALAQSPKDRSHQHPEAAGRRRRGPVLAGLNPNRKQWKRAASLLQKASQINEARWTSGGATANHAAAGSDVEDDLGGKEFDDTADDEQQQQQQPNGTAPFAHVVGSFECDWQRPDDVVSGHFYVLADAGGCAGSAGFLSKASATRRPGALATVAIECKHARSVRCAVSNDHQSTDNRLSIVIRGGRVLTFVFSSRGLLAEAANCLLKFAPRLPTSDQLLSTIDGWVNNSMVTNGSTNDDSDELMPNGHRVTHPVEQRQTMVPDLWKTGWAPVLTDVEWAYLSSGLRSVTLPDDGTPINLSPEGRGSVTAMAVQGRVALGCRGLETVEPGELFMERSLLAAQGDLVVVHTAEGVEDWDKQSTRHGDKCLDRFDRVHCADTGSAALLYFCDTACVAQLLRQFPRLQAPFSLWALQSLCARRSRFVRSLLIALSTGWVAPGLRTERWAGPVLRQTGTARRWRPRYAVVSTDGHLTIAKSREELADSSSCLCIHLQGYSVQLVSSGSAPQSASAATPTDGGGGKQPHHIILVKNGGPNSGNNNSNSSNGTPGHFDKAARNSSAPRVISLAALNSTDLNSLQSALAQSLEQMASSAAALRAVAIVNTQAANQEQPVPMRKSDLRFSERFGLPPDQRLLHELRCQGDGGGGPDSFHSGTLFISSDYVVFSRVGPSRGEQAGEGPLLLAAYTDLDQGPVFDAGTGQLALAVGHGSRRRRHTLSKFASASDASLAHDTISSFWALAAARATAAAEDQQLTARFEALFTAVDARTRTLDAKFAVARVNRPLDSVYLLRTGSIGVVGYTFGAVATRVRLRTLSTGAVFAEDGLAAAFAAGANQSLMDGNGQNEAEDMDDFLAAADSGNQEDCRLDSKLLWQRQGPALSDRTPVPPSSAATMLRSNNNAHVPVAQADYECMVDRTTVLELPVTRLHVALARDSSLALQFFRYLAAKVSDDLNYTRFSFKSLL